MPASQAGRHGFESRLPLQETLSGRTVRIGPRLQGPHCQVCICYGCPTLLVGCSGQEVLLFVGQWLPAFWIRSDESGGRSGAKAGLQGQETRVLLADSRKPSVPRRVSAAIVYAGAALTTANWLEIGLWSAQPYYSNWFDHTLMRTAIVGSALFGLAFLVSFFRLFYAVAVALAAVCLSLPYFGPMLFSLPWSDPVWRVTHSPGGAQVTAILLWFGATLYSLFEVWKWKRSREGHG